MTLKVNIYIFGLPKCTIYCKKMFLFLFLFFSMLLLCSFFRLKELFQVKSGLTTSLIFFFLFENAKNLGRSDDAKRSKKRGWPEPQSINRGENHHMYNFPMRDCTQEQNSSPYLLSSTGTIQMAVSVNPKILLPW